MGDMFGVSKSSVCDIIAEVSFLISMKLKERFIRMPTNERAVLSMKAKFYRIGNFPLIIGAIDGTQILVQSFGGDNAEYYRNRKQHFAINCQITVSADVSVHIHICIILVSNVNFFQNIYSILYQ